MSAGYGEDLWARIDGSDGEGIREAGGGLGEDAAAAADVEVAQPPPGRRWVVGGDGGAAGPDEVVAQRVHEVQDA